MHSNAKCIAWNVSISARPHLEVVHMHIFGRILIEIYQTKLEGHLTLPPPYSLMQAW